MKNLHTAAAVVFAFLLLLSASILGYADDGYAKDAAALSAVVPTTKAIKQIRTKRLATGPVHANELGAPLHRRTKPAQTHRPKNSGIISYTCDPSVAAATCNYLNTIVASDYSSSFTNANANIYITYGTQDWARVSSTKTS